MLRYTIISLLLATAACDNLKPGVAECEKYLLDKLKSPSSYKLIKAQGTAVPYENPKEYLVSIEYDADNSYGASLREKQFCSFPIKNGKPVTDHYIDFDAESRASFEKDAEALAAEALGKP